MAKEFIDICKACADTLSAASSGEFRVVNYEPFPADAAAYRDKNRLVRVFYHGGKFDNHARNRYDHEFEINIEMCVTADAESDLSTLADETSSPAELAVALASMRPSAYVADQQFNELLGMVMDILGDPANQYLGLKKHRIKGFDFIEVRKDRLLPFGEHAIITGVLVLGITVVEVLPTSVVPVPRDEDTLQLEGEVILS